MRLSKPSLPQLFPLQASLVAPPPSQLGSFRDSGVGSVNGTAITVVSSFVVKADEKVFSCTSNLATKCGANANDANPTSSLDKSDELLGVVILTGHVQESICILTSGLDKKSPFVNLLTLSILRAIGSRIAAGKYLSKAKCGHNSFFIWQLAVSPILHVSRFQLICSLNCVSQYLSFLSC